ncbi:MAG TPA: hypothetical protein PLZ36_03980 [Armatimonadota bacterium]|nr:hypothetical protein [Armatimonadota bacterium]
MKLVFTMADGRSYELSHQVYGGKAKFKAAQDAQVQLSLITEKLAYFGADDGTMLMVPQIVTAKIVE